MSIEQLPMMQPTQQDIAAWRLQAEDAIRFGGVARLGQFDWPRVVLSLIAKREKDQEATVRVGAWLSAALDDPAVCNEMKADIRAWMEVNR